MDDACKQSLDKLGGLGLCTTTQDRHPSEIVRKSEWLVANPTSERACKFFLDTQTDNVQSRGVESEPYTDFPFAAAACHDLSCVRRV
jgi:hypothetical protein